MGLIFQVVSIQQPDPGGAGYAHSQLSKEGSRQMGVKRAQEGKAGFPSP